MDHDPVSTDALRATLAEQTARVGRRDVGVIACGVVGATTATFATGRESSTGSAPSSRTLWQIGSVP